MIRENLANKRIAITGSTGFVGTALVERLLRACPSATWSCWCGRASATTPPSVCDGRSSRTTRSIACAPS